jgi:hypothetical protein
LGEGETIDVTVSINTEANSLLGGLHNDVVTFTTDGEGNTTREVSLRVDYQPVHAWPLDTYDPGWTTEGQWAFGEPTGEGGEYGWPDPESGYTGNNVYGYNLNGDYENNLSEQHLTSTAIDCTNLTEVSLKFWRWIGVEQPLYDHAYVRVSNHGTNWTTVWENTAQVTDSAWTQVEYDISSVADNQPTVYLRWTMGTTDGGWRYCGWNIDDIQIYAFGGQETCDDGIVNQGEERIDCGGPCPPCDCLSDVECDDSNFCNGAETCDAYGHCQGGSDPCDDGLACTADSCDEGADTCTHTPNDASCDDGNACTNDSCDSATGCVNDNNTDPCDDGDACTPGDTCLDGVCVSGSPLNCDDGNVCTDDSCEGGTCQYTDNTDPCDDGDACTAGDTCSEGRCTGSPLTCDACFKGRCDGSCHPNKEGPECPDCAVDCGCTIDTDCDDGDACTTDSCSGGVCSNEPLSCDDGNPCTADSCDPATGLCVNDTISTETECNDGIDNDCDGFTDSKDPDCSICFPKGSTCLVNSDCCSNKCKGKPGSKTCR